MSVSNPVYVIFLHLTGSYYPEERLILSDMNLNEIGIGEPFVPRICLGHFLSFTPSSWHDQYLNRRISFPFCIATCVYTY